MHPLPLAYGQIVGQTVLFNIDMAPGLVEGKF